MIIHGSLGPLEITYSRASGVLRLFDGMQMLLRVTKEGSDEYALTTSRNAIIRFHPLILVDEKDHIRNYVNRIITVFELHNELRSYLLKGFELL